MASGVDEEDIALGEAELAARLCAEDEIDAEGFVFGDDFVADGRSDDGDGDTGFGFVDVLDQLSEDPGRASAFEQVGHRDEAGLGSGALGSEVKGDLLGVRREDHVVSLPGRR